MRRHRSEADRQRAGDLPVGVPLHQVPEHLELAGGEAAGAALPATAPTTPVSTSGATTPATSEPTTRPMRSRSPRPPRARAPTSRPRRCRRPTRRHPRRRERSRRSRRPPVRRCSDEPRWSVAAPPPRRAAAPPARRGPTSAATPAINSRHWARSNSSSDECLIARLSPASSAASAVRPSARASSAMLYRHAPMSRSIPRLRSRANPSSSTALARARSPVRLHGLAEVDERLGGPDRVAQLTPQLQHLLVPRHGDGRIAAQRRQLGQVVEDRRQAVGVARRAEECRRLGPVLLRPLVVALEVRNAAEVRHRTCDHRVVVQLLTETTGLHVPLDRLGVPAAPEIGVAEVAVGEGDARRDRRAPPSPASPPGIGARPPRRLRWPRASSPHPTSPGPERWTAHRSRRRCCARASPGPPSRSRAAPRIATSSRRGRGPSRDPRRGPTRSAERMLSCSVATRSSHAA